MTPTKLNNARTQIANNLFCRRVELELSQQALAHECGLTRKAINEMETGKTWMNMKTFLLICKALKIAPGEAIKI